MTKCVKPGYNIQYEHLRKLFYFNVLGSNDIVLNVHVIIDFACSVISQFFFFFTRLSSFCCENAPQLSA